MYKMFQLSCIPKAPLLSSPAPTRNSGQCQETTRGGAASRPSPRPDAASRASVSHVSHGSAHALTQTSVERAHQRARDLSSPRRPSAPRALRVCTAAFQRALPSTHPVARMKCRRSHQATFSLTVTRAHTHANMHAAQACGSAHADSDSPHGRRGRGITSPPGRPPTTQPHTSRPPSRRHLAVVGRQLSLRAAPAHPTTRRRRPPERRICRASPTPPPPPPPATKQGPALSPLPWAWAHRPRLPCRPCARP